jgi:NADH dehydrogenase (ubiquinone) 1 alpha subcomplex subunit 2
MKKNNPSTPILLREAAGTLPKVYARYEFGRELSQSLEGKCRCLSVFDGGN